MVHSPSVNFAYEENNRMLTLDHPLMTAAWSWSDDHGIRFDQLFHEPSGTSWISSSRADPLFLLGVVGYGEKNNAFDKHHEMRSGKVTSVRVNETAERGCIGASLDIAMSEVSAKVTWHVQAHPHHAVLRQWFEITNTGGEVLTITRLPILLATLTGTAAGFTAYSGLERRHWFRKQEWPDWFTWQSLRLHPGVASTIHSGYRQEATWLGLLSEGGPGIFVGWESNAAATCDYGDLHGSGNCSIDVYLNPEYALEPGETLTGPAAFLGASDGDLDELCFRSHRFVEEVVAKPVDDERFPYVAFNSWGYGPDIDDASMRVCFDKCKQLGVELFVVDFGWEDPDWHPLKDKFPDGLAPLSQAAHAAGMQFGIHLSFGNASSLSEMYRDHPEWVNGPGQWAYHREGEALALSLGHPMARDWIIGKIVEIIDETQIDYFLTDHFLWGPVNPDVQQMHATNDYLTTAEGFDIVLERVQELRPHILMEHCDNGLGLPTFKMIAQHVTSIGPDAVGSQYERVHTWRMSHVFPPRYLDHYVCERHAPDIPFHKPFGDYEYRSQIFGGPMILMTDIMALEEDSDDWNALVRAIDLVKRIRRRVVEGKVLHLLEPQPYERVGDGWDGWDAIGSYHAESDSAVILAFRLGGNLDARTIPVHGLDPETQYRISFEDRTETFERSGAELMAEGIHLSLPGPDQTANVDELGFVRASEVIHLNAVT